MSELTVITQDFPIASYEGKVTVSQSEVDAYLRCERNHFYGYGLLIQRRKTSDALARGIIGHSALQHYFTALRDGGTVDEARAACVTYLTEQFTVQPENSVLLYEIIETLKYFFIANPFEGWRILAVEKEFVLKIYDDVSFPFIVDLIAEDLYGNVWVIDHKFIYDFISERDEELMPQLLKYFAALRALGFKVDKIAYNQLRHRVQKEMSVATKHRFREVPINYAAMVRFAREQTFIATRLNQIRKQEIVLWSQTAMRVANKMVCNNCSFRSLCIAELNETNPQLVLDSEYIKRERREFKVLEEA